MAAERIPGGFGSKLREARERRGISLRQIANATKISVGALEALERNDISRLPGGIFSRAFVRSYAIEVGLDPEATIQEFIAQFPHDSVTAGHPASEHGEDNERSRATGGWRRPFSGWLRSACRSPASCCTSAPAATGPARSRGRCRVRSPPRGLARQRGEPAPAVEPTRPEPASTSASPAAPVAATAGRRAPQRRPIASWSASRRSARAGCRRRSMEQPPLSGCCGRASADARRAARARADGGDAGALALTLNGPNARPLGKAGEVVTARLNLANFKDYLAAR